MIERCHTGMRVIAQFPIRLIDRIIPKGMGGTVREEIIIGLEQHLVEVFFDDDLESSHLVAPYDLQDFLVGAH